MRDSRARLSVAACIDAGARDREVVTESREREHEPKGEWREREPEPEPEPKGEWREREPEPGEWRERGRHPASHERDRASRERREGERRDEVAHYVVVRDDVPTGVAFAMTLHAAGESAQRPSACSAAPPTIAVVLVAAPGELDRLADELLSRAIPHAQIRESDPALAPSGDTNALMAIGVVPMPRVRVRRLLAHLSLIGARKGRS